MSSRQIILKHYQKLLSAWPVDALRPEVSFQKALQRRIDTRIAETSASQEAVVHNQAQVTIAAPKPFNEKSELEQVNALYALLDNRYAKRYPLSEKFLKPASNPSYYEALAKEMEEAPQRSWLQSKLVKWRGFLRIK